VNVDLQFVTLADFMRGFGFVCLIYTHGSIRLKSHETFVFDRAMKIKKTFVQTLAC
jgi:hypothetical protein